MKALRWAVPSMLVLLVVGCASSGESGDSPSRDGDILPEEIETISATHALEVVRVLRPRWFRFRAARTPGNPVPRVGVVVDGRPRGTLEDLALIPAQNVARIRFFNGPDATIRFGTDYGGGAIVVTTKGAG